jgi:EamA domain-containing membrane protein RarD
MAIPSFGGMVIEVLTMLVVPVLYATVKEFRLHTRIKESWVGVFLFLTALLGFFALAVYCAACDALAKLRRRTAQDGEESR